MEAPPNQSDAPLTERQQRRRFEKAVVKEGFQGTVTINSDHPHEAVQYASLGYVYPSHWGDENGRMVFWAKGSTVAITNDSGTEQVSGLGIISETSPDPEQWAWSAYRVMRDIDDTTVVILALAMALKIAGEKCGELKYGERPARVLVYSCSSDALRGMQRSDSKNTTAEESGGKMSKAARRVVDTALVAAHELKEMGIEVELRWIPDGCDVEGFEEAVCAAGEGVKHVPPTRGPDAFIRDIQAEYKRKSEKRRRREVKWERRRKEADLGREKMA